jgi:ribosomal protein S18 acetylase RimI-like enzyme
VGVEVVEIAEADIRACAAVLAQAFDQDPLQLYMLPDPATRQRVSPRLFEASVQYGFLCGRGLRTSGECRGAAVWLRPGESEFTAARAEAAGMAAVSHAMGAEASDRSLRIWRHFAGIRAREAGARYWYLLVIGVLPACQGQGIGGALMRPVLAQADRDDLPCFVETVQPRNQPLYERHGFRLVHDHVDDKSGLRLLSFVRPPRA